MPQDHPKKQDGPSLRLAFLWHQHQPYYKNLLTGEYLLSWVRLHGVKDYLDMIEILDNHPTIKQTFNMVPSLLEQLNDYAEGTALDPHLALSIKKAEELTPEDKEQILGLLFQANYDNLIAPIRRYASLYRERSRALAAWTAVEWRDLQALANLAWIDPMFKKSGRLKMLSEKGERYTEEDKQEVLDEQRKIIARIVPSLKEHMERGQIEVSVSPYFHPILPLLCDTSIALTAMPRAPMPKKRFQHAEDADRQIADAIELYKRLFGREPAGMWPSEGSVSEDIIPILARHGIRWTATDEEILSESLGIPGRSGTSDSLIASGRLYTGYRFEKKGSSMAIFFRDHALSDNIGFVYSNWDAEKAADDFMSKLQAIHKNLAVRRVSDPIVSVVLDGENAWEYYKNDGHDFLDALYAKIANAPWLETVTFSGFLDQKPQLGQLTRLFPGSWISHNFSVWIGHDEDNKAWDLLSRTRDELAAFQVSHPEFDRQRLEAAWKEIYVAEGSDWCWWFGEDHIGPNNDDFDRLFRSHLANVYSLTDREPPAELLLPVRSSFLDAHISKPVDYVTPVIDGRTTHYYEWQQAGYFDCTKAGSTMHKAERLVSGWWFGFDRDNLYSRVDRGITVSRERFQKFTFEIEFLAPVKAVVSFRSSEDVAQVDGKPEPRVKKALEDVLELAIPLSLFAQKTGNVLLARLSIREQGKTMEIWPPTEALRIELPAPGAHEIPWVV